MKLALPLTLLCACGLPAYLPDGGRPRQVCTNTVTVIPVHAVDAQGMPVPDAAVVAHNTSNGKIVNATTNGGGDTTQLTEDIGTGQIEITATAGALKTAHPFIVQINCGDCDCTAVPSSAQLTMTPQ
jgi:hypothetical protein